MALRRKAVAPQTEYAVLDERLQKLENQMKQLRQAGTSTLQAEDPTRIADPVPFQTMINPAGTHVDALPDSPMVYYHPGDDATPTGVTPAGFKALGTTIPGVEVYYDTSFTDWGTSMTQLQWSDIADPQEYDAVTPTFAVNGNGNIEIFKHGVYFFALFIFGGADQTGVVTRRDYTADFISGETPSGPRSWNASHYSSIFNRAATASVTINGINPRPVFLDMFSYQLDTFGPGTAGPGELEIRACKFEDGVEVAELANMQVHIGIIRVGAAWS